MPNASVRRRARLPLALLLWSADLDSPCVPLLPPGLALVLSSPLALSRALSRSLCAASDARDLCADELIRQVTIECAERGLLFLRIRDEARMRIAAYQTLYESSLAFAVRKAVQGEEEKNVLEGKIKDMMSDRREKLKYIAELQDRADSSDAIDEERWQTMKKKQVTEIKSLKELYKNQTKQLQEALAPPPGFVRPA